MAVVLGYQAMLGFYEFTFLALTSNEFKRKTNYCQLELSLLFNLAFYREATLIPPTNYQAQFYTTGD